MRSGVYALIVLIAALGAADRVKAADVARKTSTPFDLGAAAKGAPPPPGWNKRLRTIRKIKPRTGLAAGGDPADVTGAAGARGTQAAGKVSGNGGTGKPATPEADPAQFCSNVADAASDARLAWQMGELQKAEGQLRERIAELEAKRAEYEKWLKLREDFLKKAEDNVITIYSRMRPEAAALQLASMVDETAAAVLAKLNPRNSSAILNEMEPARAAHLANTLAGMRQVDSGKAAK